MVSGGATVSATASRFCEWVKRKEGSPAITKMVAKSRINMSVFLLTAAKVIILGEKLRVKSEEFATAPLLFIFLTFLPFPFH